MFYSSHFWMSDRKTNILSRMFYCFQLSVKIPFPEIGFTLLPVLVLIWMCVWFGLFLLILLSTITYHSFASLCYTNNSKPSHHEWLLYLFSQTIITFYFPWQASETSHSFRIRSASHTRTQLPPVVSAIYHVNPCVVRTTQWPSTITPFSARN
jgi:hypothetical protein